LLRKKITIDYNNNNNNKEMSQTSTKTTASRMLNKHKDEKSLDRSRDNKSNKKHKGSSGIASKPRIDIHKYDNPLVGYLNQYTDWFRDAMTNLQQLWLWNDAIPIVYSYLVFDERFLPGSGQNRQMYEYAIAVQFMLYDMSVSDFTPLESMYWFLGFLHSNTFKRIPNDALLGLVSSDYETLNSLIGLQDIRVTTKDRPRTRGGELDEYNPFNRDGDVRSGHLRCIRYGITPPLAIKEQLRLVEISGAVSMNRHFVEFLFDSGLFCPGLSDFEFDDISVGENAYLDLAQELLLQGQMYAFQTLREKYHCELSRMVDCALYRLSREGVYGFEWEFGRCTKLNKQQTRTLRYLLENTHNTAIFQPSDSLVDAVSNWHMPAWERDPTYASSEEIKLEKQQEIIDDNVVEDWTAKDEEERKQPFVIPDRLE
jgi:hypothetical protein